MTSTSDGSQAEEQAKAFARQYAKEFATSLIKEASPAEDATAEVVPEASGD